MEQNPYPMNHSQSNCTANQSQSQVYQQVNQVATYKLTLEEPEPLTSQKQPAYEFPVQCLNPILKDGISFVILKNKSSFSIVAQSMLAALALAVQAHNQCANSRIWFPMSSQLKLSNYC